MNDKFLTPSEIESLRKNKSDSYYTMLEVVQQKKMVEALNRCLQNLKSNVMLPLTVLILFSNNEGIKNDK